MLKWLGFSNTTIEVEHKPRFAGSSSYNFFKLLKIGLQGWTSHSVKLLKFSTYFGFILAFLSFLAALSVLIRYIFFDFLPGWPSIIISILFSTGLILLSIGIAGIYIGKTFEQTKERPLFIIEEEININE
jgi:polyisoprenyl-phosphate glycosyltransferase